MMRMIGFDRDIKLEWLDAVASQVASGRSSHDVRRAIHRMLGGVLASGKPGAALTKTTTVLLHVWSQVPDEAVALRDRIVAVLPELRPKERLVAHWSMCIATYPFFQDVATNAGRLLGLQGEVSLASLKRRLAERWGDRSLMPQATRKVIRSMVGWGVLRDVKAGVYAAPQTKCHAEGKLGTFLVEALLVGSGRGTLSVRELERHPALFPFRIAMSSSVLRTSKRFSVHRQGVDFDIVELASL